jgi:4-hydroxy-tetrahydrodipicolinate synthase
MMRDAVFGGVNAAVLTAMRADLSVDVPRWAAHCKWLLANGCDGLGVFGTTGEANSIGVEERMELLEALIGSGVPARVMMPGTGMPSITDTVKLTRHAEKAGCRGALLLPPYFYKNPSEDGLFAYFSEVIQRVGGDIKIYLYHFPAQSAVPFSVALIGRLLKAYPGKVKGIKDSTGDFANTRAYADAYAKDGFEVYCGDDSSLLDLLKVGGAGCITAAANVGSAVSARVYANWDNALGAQTQPTLTAIRKAVVSAPLIPALKALIARHTGDAAWNNIRPPHMALSAEAAAGLYATFDAIGLELAKAA